jgi:hypothetical protein
MLRPTRAIVIAYGAPAFAALAYLTFWPICLNIVLHRHRPIDLAGPLLSYPFGDLDSVLVALRCVRQGVEVTLPNACMGGGLFQYSPLLLTASALPIGPWLRVPGGIALDALLLLSLYALPHPRNWREFWSLLLAALSCGTFFALECANLDIALYALVLLAAHLLLGRAGLRAAGYAAILVAAAIKFYPGCLMILAARERPARCVTIALAALAGAGLFAVAFAGPLGQILPNLPGETPFGDRFGASNLPGGIALLLSADDPDGVRARLIRLAAMTALVCLCASVAGRWLPALLPALRRMAPRSRMLLVAGAASVTFCFVAAQNILYREIFLILTLPGLWDLARDAPQPALRVRARLASRVVVGLMWAYYLHLLSVAWPAGQAGSLMTGFLIWVAQEALWWWLIGLFAAVLFCFLWDAPVVAQWRRRAVA